MTFNLQDISCFYQMAAVISVWLTLVTKLCFIFSKVSTRLIFFSPVRHLFIKKSLCSWEGAWSLFSRGWHPVTKTGKRSLVTAQRRGGIDEIRQGT